MRRMAAVLAASVAVAALLSVPARAATSGHYERPAQARADIMHFTWSSPWRYNKVVSTYIEGWQRFRRPKIGIQWYPVIKVSKPCYPPHCVVTKPAALPDSGSNGIFHYDAAAHRVSVTWHYSPRFVRNHFHRSNQRDPWWAPWTWCWSCAWHDLWSSIIKPCANGLVTLTGLRGANVVAQKMLDEGAAFVRMVGRFSGPEGWGATMLGGCIFGIVFKKVSAGRPPQRPLALDGRLEP
jgi:hypothetical protein